MNLYDIQKPLTQMAYEEVKDFIRELRYQRTVDHSPPKKEKKKREKKEKKTDISLLFQLTSEQADEFLLLLEKEKEKNEYSGTM